MNNKIGKQALKIGLSFVSVLGLVVGMAFPVFADTPTPNTPAFHTVQGSVSSVTAPSLVVLTSNQQSVTITTDSNSQYYLIPMGKVQGYVNNRVATDNKEDKKEGTPAQSRAAQLKDLHIPADWRSNLGWLAIFDNQASFSDIAVGDRIIVRADSANLAKQIMIIKAPVNRTIKGSIVLTDPTHITINQSNGSGSITLNVTGTTLISLKGQTTISGYAVVLYNSANNNALTVNVQATAPAPAPVATNSPSITLTSIAIAPAPSANLTVNATQQFTATATYSNSTIANVTSQATWVSSDTTKATISSPGGVATGIAAGATIITASLSGITSPAVLLNVVSP